MTINKSSKDDLSTYTKNNSGWQQNIIRNNLINNKR